MNVNVDMNESRISYSYIETDALSTCLGMLMDGVIGDKSFCFLWHSSQVDELPDDNDNLYDLLVHLLKKVVKMLKKKLLINSISTPGSNKINNISLLIAGGAVDEHQLTRKAYHLLNENIDFNSIKHLTNNVDVLYLIEKLKNSVVIIQPVTYVMQDDDENKGRAGERVFDPPGIWLKYNCLLKVGCLGVEWLNSPLSVDFASMYVRNLKNHDSKQCKWYWREENAIIAKKKIQNNRLQLDAFINDANFFLTKINSNMCQTWAKHAVDFVIDIELGISNPLINCNREICQCIEILSSETKNNIILIGDPGVGKSAIITGLAQYISKGFPQDIINDLAQRNGHQNILDTLPKYFLELNMMGLIGCTNSYDEFEERLKSILKEIKNSNNEIILFIDKIHLILDVENTKDAMDKTKFLKMILGSDEFHCICTTTFDQYEKDIEKNSDFGKYFQQIHIEERSVMDSILILRRLKSGYESKFGVQILDSALIQAAQLSYRYIRNQALPGKAIDLVYDACKIVQMQVKKQIELNNQSDDETISSSEENDESFEQDLKEGSDETFEQDLKEESDETFEQDLKEENDEAFEQDLKEELANVPVELTPPNVIRTTDQGHVNQFENLKQKSEDFQNKPVKTEQENDFDSINDDECGAIPKFEGKFDETNYSIEEDEQRQQDQLSRNVVGTNVINEIVSRYTNIPPSELSKTEDDRILKLTESLHKNVIGQDDAIDNLVAVFKYPAKFLRSNQSIRSFLFLGPNGVGKTELAKTLALQLFNSTKSMIQINLSEYTECLSFVQLINSLTAFQQKEQLTETVSKLLYSVILFDQIDKAQPQILKILSEILSVGRFTDEENRIIDFTNTIIILKSNIGTRGILEEVENSTSSEKNLYRKLSRKTKDKIMEEIRLSFQPEFLNYLNSIIFFQCLNTNHILSIIHLQLKSLEEHFKEQNLMINLTDKATQSILNKSYNSVNGVHPLKLHFEKHITTEISKLLNQMKCASPCQITIDNDANDHYQFQIEQLQKTSSNSPTQSAYNRRRTFDEFDDKSTTVDDTDEEYNNIQFVTDTDNSKASKRMKQSPKVDE